MGEFHGAYGSVDEMMESMGCELEWMPSSPSSKHSFNIFRSKNKDELRRLLTDSGIITTLRSTVPLLTRAIKFFLECTHMENYLVQIWAPMVIGNKRVLTTSDQLFVLGRLVKGPCLYRKHCLNCLLPVDDMSTLEEGHVGPPSRVFLNGMPEVCCDVRHYTTKEYPQRDHAITLGIRCHLAFPVPKFFNLRPDYVVEVVANGFQPEFCLLGKYALRYPWFTVEPMKVVSEIEKMLEAVCKTHQLPLAQSWVSMPFSLSYKNEVRYEKEGSYIRDIELRNFTKACGTSYIKKGRGVVGKASSSKGACFCKDISRLSINEYSLLPNARKARLTGCFAISLRNTSSALDYVYIVEFFLSSKGTENGDPRTLIKMLLATMKQQLKSFKVASAQELGEKIFVEVIKTSPTDELDCFEVCDVIGIDSTRNTVGYPYGGEIVQLDSTMGAAENALGGESDEVHGMAPVKIGLSMPMQFASSSHDNHSYARKMHQEGTEAFPAARSIMDPYAGKDKDSSALQHGGAANVLPDAHNLHQHGEVVHFVRASSHVADVNTAEQNIVGMEQCDINSIGEIVQLDDTINNAANMNINDAEQNFSMEQRHTNSKISKNQRAIKRIKRQYGITLAALLQQSEKKQEEAADHFGVSRSTFKRICREHQIFRWPPRKVKHGDTPSNIAPEFVQHSKKIVEDSRSENLSLPVQSVGQDLNSKPDSTQNAMTVENGSSIVVKVTYKDKMIKFCLSVSSKKMALEDEIAKRFGLAIGSFIIKYLDEDEDWIWVNCDEDLKTCISIMRSLGKNTVKMLVNLSQDN